MPLSASRINKFRSTSKEQWKPMGGGCYLVVPKSSTAKKRFVGKTRIGSPSRKIYSVTLGFWEKDFTKPSEVLKKWDELKSWGEANNRDLRTYGERLTLDKKNISLEEVVDLFIDHKTHHQKSDSSKTFRNRFNRIIRRLPEGILINELAGYEGTQLIKKRVLDPDVSQGKLPTAKRYRQMLNNLFNFAVADRLVHPEQIPYRLDVKFPFESEHTSNPHPHLSWDVFRNEFIPKLNANTCNAGRLTDLTTKAVLLMLTRVSAVVSLQWDWFDADKNCWVIPSETKGIKRKKGDVLNDHYIPNTPQLNRLMDTLCLINGHEKYVFYSPYKGNNPYVSHQTPNDHLINLKFQGRQDAHGFRHVATNALVDIGGYEREMVSRCLGHLHNDGAIGHYDFAKRLDKRREIHEYWSSLLIQDAGLKI